MNLKKINATDEKINIISVNKFSNFNNKLFCNPFIEGKFYIDNFDNLVFNITVFNENCINEVDVTKGEFVGVLISLDSTNIYELYVNENKDFVAKYKNEEINHEVDLKTFKGNNQKGLYWSCNVKVDLYTIASYFDIQSDIYEDMSINFLSQFIIENKKYISSYHKIKNKCIASVENTKKIVLENL